MTRTKERSKAKLKLAPLLLLFDLTFLLVVIVFQFDNQYYFMSKCPNCFYELVLLEHRRKYKCAKCSRLFPQVEIESKEFREWNKKKRLISRKEYTKDWNQEYRKNHPERVKEWRKKWVSKNRDKVNAYQREYNRVCPISP